MVYVMLVESEGVEKVDQMLADTDTMNRRQSRLAQLDALGIGVK